MAVYFIRPGNVELAEFAHHEVEGYVLLNPDGSPLPSAPSGSRQLVPALGHGGFGAVVRATYKGLPRAVKFLDPAGLLKSARRGEGVEYFSPGRVPTDLDAASITKHLSHELTHTNARTFKNVNPIVDHGIFKDRLGRRVPYYAAPFIEGQTLHAFFKSARLTHTEAQLRADRRLRHDIYDLTLSLVDDLLAGLTELEDAGVSHIDIKPANLMVLPATERDHATSVCRDKLFIIDLGCAVSSRSSATRVPLLFTQYYFPMHLVPQLGFADGYVEHKALVKLGPAIDMYAVGRILELFTCDRVRRSAPNFTPNAELEVSEPAKESFWRLVLEEDFEVFEGLVGRLMDQGKNRFSTPAEAQAAFQALAKRYSQNTLASWVLTDSRRGLKIQVGPTTVRVAPPFNAIVNHPAFQRLRRLQQLTLVSQTFPDATHTRFAHSLNTFHLAKRFILGLSREATFRLMFTPKDTEHVLAAALLHDLGQYPFTHTIEDLRKIGTKFNAPHLKAILHDQEMAEQYLDRKDGTTKSIRQILESAGYSVEDVLYMVGKKEKGPDKRAALNVGRDLVSGIVDVDRVSYLLQDSSRTGVPYGGAIDVDELVEALCVRDVGAEPPSLAVDEGGQSAVEAVLTAVYWMYRNVYWTPANRGFMAAVKFVMSELLESGALTFADYAEHVYGRSEWEAMEYLDSAFRQQVAHGGQDSYFPLASLLSNRRFSYNRVYSVGMQKGNDEIFAGLVQHTSPALLRDLTSAIEGALAKSAQVRLGEILVDIPLKPRLREPDAGLGLGETESEAGTRPKLWVRRVRKFSQKDNGWRPLSDCSPLAAVLGDIEDDSRKARVFFAHELVDRLGNTRSLQQSVHEAITKHLGLT